MTQNVCPGQINFGSSYCKFPVIRSLLHNLEFFWPCLSATPLFLVWKDTAKESFLVIVSYFVLSTVSFLLLFFCQADNKSSAWKAYMEEVKKYKEMTCSEDGDRVCPLVK